VKNVTVHRGTPRAAGTRAGLAMVPSRQEPESKIATPPLGAMESGIVVREEELGACKAQRLYKMRCECGRSWFELELPTLIECPACKKLCLVSA
jgi:hypothetical protein